MASNDDIVASGFEARTTNEPKTIVVRIFEDKSWVGES